MRPDALLLKIHGISEVLLIIDHPDMGIMGKTIGGIRVLILMDPIVDFKLNGIVNWRKACNSLIALPYCFFLFSKIPDGFVLSISVC
jgi:hypothetical protein